MSSLLDIWLYEDTTGLVHPCKLKLIIRGGNPRQDKTKENSVPGLVGKPCIYPFVYTLFIL